MKRLLVALAVALAVAPTQAPTASADVVWLCRPGEQPNPCAESLETTVQGPDGSSRVENPPFPADPAFDCFYVYPTVSDQPTTNADKTKDDRLVAIARYQAARYSSLCGVFAPVYRQLTVPSIFTGTPEQRAEGRRIAFADVREAWLEYLARDNRGRGVVLVGHSQGAGMLRQLIRAEIDGDPQVRGRIISAILLGGNVTVRKGARIGGDFQNLPACTSPTALGCVIAYSIFDEDPPDNTRFGRVPATDTTGAGLPAGPEYEVLCTNPGSLAANARATFTSLVRTEPFPGSVGLALLGMYGGSSPSAPTPWVQPADRYAGRCEQRNGANVLFVEAVGDSRDLHASPTPDWGLHLADANLPLVELIGLVRAQALAYLARGTSAPRLRLVASCTRRRLRLRVAGPDAPRIRRLVVRARGRRVAGDADRPFAVTLARRLSRVRLLVVATLDDGRRATLPLRARRCR